MRGIDQTKAGIEVISNTLPGMQAMMGIFDSSIAQGLAEVQSGKGFSPASGTFNIQELSMDWMASYRR